MNDLLNLLLMSFFKGDDNIIPYEAIGLKSSSTSTPIFFTFVNNNKINYSNIINENKNEEFNPSNIEYSTLFIRDVLSILSQFYSVYNKMDIKEQFFQTIKDEHIKEFYEKCNNLIENNYNSKFMDAVMNELKKNIEMFIHYELYEYCSLFNNLINKWNNRIKEEIL